MENTLDSLIWNYLVLNFDGFLESTKQQQQKGYNMMKIQEHTSELISFCFDLKYSKGFSYDYNQIWTNLANWN